MDIFDLCAKISVDTSDYEKGMEDASSSSEKHGNAIANILGGVGKAVAVGLTASAVGVTALTKSIVDAYADYEQLVGGVETLFGTGGLGMVEWAKQNNIASDQMMTEYDKMMKAQETVIENSKDAYKTAGLSANEYMETVTSFSASLIQSLDGDTQAAAEKSNQAIIQMSDNANKMGTDISSIQNAYQGFAKQNYTMLDNLKLGYGGTKEEMERLLEDASKVSGIEYDISSYADIIDAIKVVQDEMGITGTTAKEASSTISGSLGMVKSAWANVVTMMATGGDDLEDSIDALVESAETFVGNIIPVVEDALGGISTLISDLAPVIAEALPPLIEEVLPSLISAVLSLFNGLVQALPTLIQVIVEQLPIIITTLLETLTTLLPQLITVGMDAIVQLATGIAQALPTMIPQIVEVMLTIVNTLLDNIDQLIDASIILITALAEGLIEALPILIEKAPEIIIKLVSAFTENLPKIIALALVLIKTLAESLIKYIPTLIASVPKLVEAIVQKFKDMVQSFIDIGKNIVEGIKTGIANAWNQLVDWIVGLCDALVDKVKSFFGIASPSKVFKEIGGFLAQGLGVGWENEFGDVQKNITSNLDFAATPITVSSNTTATQYTNAMLSMMEQLLSNTTELPETIGASMSNVSIGINNREFGRLVRGAV